MFSVLAAVALGILVGRLNFFPYSQKTLSKITIASLLVMLVAMGAQLGTNDKLLADLGRIGWQALVLASGSIIGSLILVRLAENHIASKLEQSRQRAKSKVGDH